MNPPGLLFKAFADASRRKLANSVVAQRFSFATVYTGVATLMTLKNAKAVDLPVIDRLRKNGVAQYAKWSSRCTNSTIVIYVAV
jgi:hypothetical protein